MSRRPKHVYEIVCMRCDYQSDCDKFGEICPSNREIYEQYKDVING